MKTNTTKILKFLKKVEEATPTEIQKQTKIPYYLLTFYLPKMVEKGYISKRQNDNETFTYYKFVREELEQ